MKPAHTTTSPGRVWMYTLAAATTWTLLAGGLLAWSLSIGPQPGDTLPHLQQVSTLVFSLVILWLAVVLGVVLGGWYAARRVRDQLRAIRAFGQSEENLRFVLATSASDLFYQWDVATGELDWIGDIENALGYARGSIPHTLDGWLELIHPHDREAIAAALEDHGNNGAPIELSYRMLHRDGHVQYWQQRGVAILDEHGKPLRVTCVCTDVTEHRQAEEALHESEQRFMDVLLNSNDAILLIDGETFVECNRATTEMLGYVSRREFLMTHPSKLSPPKQPDGRDSFEKANEMMRLATEKGYHRFQWQHVRANGEEFPVEVSLTPIKYQGRTVLHCLWRDLTEQNRIMGHLQKENDDLRQRVMELSSLVAVHAHAEQPGEPPEIIYGHVVNMLPLSFRYPSSASACLVLDGKVFESENFLQTQWSLETDIVIDGEVRGALRVYYNREFPDADHGPFFEEEKQFLQAMALRLVKVIQRTQQ